MPCGRRRSALLLAALSWLLGVSTPAQIPASVSLSEESPDSPGWYDHDLTVVCTDDEMLVSISPKSTGVSFLDNDIRTRDGGFSGMVYPRGLERASGCMVRYRKAPGPLMFRLPLRACNTMPYTMDDGSIEYRNILMVQPHPRLVTGHGKSHEVSCKPPNPNPGFVVTGGRSPHAARLIDFKPGDAFDVSTLNTDKLPSVTMKIFKGDPAKREIATNVKIGDPLTLTISLEKELGKHGMQITDCIVKDGLGWAHQNLINIDGCPLDNEIMGMFDYSPDRTSASVTFQAHKFPYTPSVYYQCNVKLCEKTKCNIACDPTLKSRPKRQSNDDEEEAPATIEIFSGLYVNEATDLPPDTDYVTKEKNPEDAICISQRNFAIAICIAGLVLMLTAVAAILVILARRRGPKSISNGSSIYSGPYTNTGYSHTS